MKLLHAGIVSSLELLLSDGIKAEERLLLHSCTLNNLAKLHQAQGHSEVQLALAGLCV